jgi:hypothetical protein
MTVEQLLARWLTPAELRQTASDKVDGRNEVTAPRQDVEPNRQYNGLQWIVFSSAGSPRHHRLCHQKLTAVNVVTRS